MKSNEQVLNALNRWLEANWPQAVMNLPGFWPRRIKLSAPAGAALEMDFPAALDWAHQWQDWARAHRVELVIENRRVAGTSQHLPAYLHIPDLDTAARLLGGVWPTLLRTAQARAATIRDCFPDVDPVTILRELAGLSSTDFALLVTAAEWFRLHDAAGLTPRQVPIQGLHSKWLNTRQQLVRYLSGKDNLGLVRRPRTVHFTYVDENYLNDGGRRYDSATEGDTGSPAYTPQRIIITENKDTALFFPCLPKGIVMQGNGTAGPVLLPGLQWVSGCAAVFYWGDLDAEGFEIINQYRNNGLNVITVLMDRPTLEEYRTFGVCTDPQGRSLLRARKSLPLLTEGEREAYDALTDPLWGGPYRLEQERIPLHIAHARVIQILGDAASDGRDGVKPA